MKHFFLPLLGLIFLAGNPLFAQQKNYENNCSFFLTVKNEREEPVPFLDVYLEETVGKEKLTAVTNEKGKAQFTVITGRSYSIGLPGFPGVATHTVSRSGGIQVKTVYFKGKASSGIREVTMDQTTVKPGASEALVKVQLIEGDASQLAGLPVSLFSKKINRRFNSMTDGGGAATFSVPVDQIYLITVEDATDMEQILVPNRPGALVGKRFSYVPTPKFPEIQNGDTIIQQLPGNAGPTTARAFVDITVRDLNDRILPGEIVCLQLQGSSTVYKAVSDASGKARFLLPKGKKYVLHFKYDREIDVLDIQKMYSLRNIVIDYNYMGSQKIEEFYRTAARSKDGFITSFNTTPVYSTKPLINKQTVKDGYNVTFEGRAPMPVPAYGNGKIFTSGGFYSKEFMALKASTGEPQWAVNLSESGASSAIYENGIVLVNTYSCTLYALDAETGKLIWSKWLGPTLYSTPAVSAGKVYTAYPNDINTSGDSGKDFVMVCFDLKTGNVVWQNWLPAEVLGCPVIASGQVYATTLNGVLCRFDALSGLPSGKINGSFSSPPTIAGNQIFIGKRQAGNPSRQMLVSLDAKTLKEVKSYSTLQASYTMDRTSANTLMNYSGIRTVQAKGKNFNVADNKILCTDPSTGQVLWTSEIEGDSLMQLPHTSFAPVVMGNMIGMAGPGGEVKFYEASTGKQTASVNMGTGLYNQPVAAEGYLFSGGDKGVLSVRKSPVPQENSYPMWGKGADHNPVSQ